jgi:outer membrane protein TolC
MKRRIYLLLLLAVVSTGCHAYLTLKDCHAKAHDNYPAIKQYGLVEQSRDYTVANAGKGWLPQVSVSASAMYIGDVLDMPASMKSMVDMGHTAYNAAVTVNQTIYDGGAIASRQRMAKAEADVSTEQLNVTMYDINDRIDQLFFGILIIDEQLKQNLLLQKDLEISRNSVTNMMKGGLANQTDVDAVKVEEIKTRQAETAMRASRHAYMDMLGTFIGMKLADDTQLVKPADAEVGQENNRPELKFYSARSSLLNAQRKQLDANLMPRLSAFAAGMYGHLMTDMMKKAIYGAGITLSWNIGALYTRSNDIKKIELQRAQIDAERETFLFNTRLQDESGNGKITALKRQISMDDEIIALRESIRDKAEKKVRGGTETINEMLRDVNAVSEARQSKAVHEITMLQETYRLRNLYNE